MRIMILAAIAALAFTSATDAASQCKDPKTGKFIKCPAAAAAPAATPAASTAKKPHCTTGVPCGDSCIAKGKVCHKPA